MAASRDRSLAEFLQPFHVDAHLVRRLSRELAATFRHLSAESLDQFLPTPISESILRHVASKSRGRYLAIDIGGTNLRVGFVELLGPPPPSGGPGAPRLRRLLERSWPIQEHLKNENTDGLFAWIGANVARVVRDGVAAFALDPAAALPMGVTFSFPMVQRSLSEATLMPMGKGFAITSDLDLAHHLLRGYERHRRGRRRDDHDDDHDDGDHDDNDDDNDNNDLPRIRIAAITNDSVATLVSFLYQFEPAPPPAAQKACMGLIVGTGCNATIPLKLSSLHASKRPAAVSVLPGPEDADVRIAVNTEWSIHGTAPPLRRLGLVTRWDEQLDAAGEKPGFQPLEYMTAGRYLGELGRLLFVEYLTRVAGADPAALPARLHQRFGVTTTFLSHFRPGSARGPLLAQLAAELPVERDTSSSSSPSSSSFQWTQPLADALYAIARAIEVRAAGIVAAATAALLVCAEEIPTPPGPNGAAENATNGSANGPAARATTTTKTTTTKTELVVGYTGGCIEHFQDYLADCQRFLDEMLALEFDGRPPVRVLLSPCHDGGITGAGILVPAALASESK